MLSRNKREDRRLQLESLKSWGVSLMGKGDLGLRVSRTLLGKGDLGIMVSRRFVFIWEKVAPCTGNSCLHVLNQDALFLKTESFPEPIAHWLTRLTGHKP